MKTLMPPTGLMTLRKELDRLVDRFWDNDLLEMPALGEWTPVLDMHEDKDRLIVKAEIPGLDPADIRLTLRDQVLTVTGDKKREKEEKDAHFYRMERAWGTFARSIRLPVPVDAAKVHAAFKNGILTIQLPKVTMGPSSEIPIKME
jgi:HSP20 family protein